MYIYDETVYDQDVKRWWTSDLHLGHARINELAGRPFASVDEMNAAIVERWNATVSPRDTVYVLGDVCMGDLRESLALAAQLQGRKRLVPGNHDRVSSLYRGSPVKKAEWRQLYLNAGFEVLSEELRAGIGDASVKVSHFPYDGDSHDEDRYKSSRPIDDGGWLLHGHVHEAWKVRGRQINVGCDVWNFTPVSEEQLMEIISDG